MPVRLRNRLLLALAAFSAVVVIALRGHDGAESSTQKTAVDSVTSSTLRRESSSTVESAIPSTWRSSVATCEGQALELTLNEAPSAPCFDSTSATQNGSVRSYRIEFTQGPARTLRIDASGTLVVAAYLSTDSMPRLQCRESDCKGISIGPRNADGARTISLRQIVLTAAPNGAAILSGDIKTEAESQLPGVACNDEGITIIATDGSVTPFCAKGGVGFEIGDDGKTTYRFTNLDNESLLVVLNSSRVVQRVEISGESAFACQGGDCRQIHIPQLESSGEQTFQFGGTSLIDTRSGERNVILNGTLVVPPL